MNVIQSLANMFYVDAVRADAAASYPAYSTTKLPSAFCYHSSSFKLEFRADMIVIASRLSKPITKAFGVFPIWLVYLVTHTRLKRRQVQLFHTYIAAYYMQRVSSNNMLNVFIKMHEKRA